MKDNDGFAEFLVGEASKPREPEQVARDFVQRCFGLVAEALPTADRDNTLEGDLEIISIETAETLVAAGLDEKSVASFVANIMHLLETGLTNKMSVEQLRAESTSILRMTLFPNLV